LPVTAASGVRFDDAYTTFQLCLARTTVTVAKPSAETTPPNVWRKTTAWTRLPRNGAAVSRRRCDTDLSRKSCLCAASQLRAAAAADDAVIPVAR
jgi:hypothetical protein